MSSASISPASGSPVAEHASGPVALAGAPRPAGAPKPKPRKRVNTAEKRHQHNAIERQRRETLNSKFLVLARLLPSLAACRRPSKSAIVNGSITHLAHQRNQRLLAAKLLRQLNAERDELIAEVNQWRQANGCQPKPARQWTDEMEEICQVEKEKFGSFANVDENGDDQGDDDDEPADTAFDSMNIETANLVAGSYSTGLVTPRSSTDMSSSAMSVNNFNWTGSTYTIAPAPSLPFNAFMSDNVESSSIPSPVGSSHNGSVLTPKSAVDPATMYTHTPSPGSSSSPEDTSARQSSPTQQWPPQQLNMFQQQVQHQNMHHHHQQALAAALAAHPQGDLGNLFLGGSQQFQQPQQAGLAHLMATMFPQQSSEQVEQWRKIAMGGLMSQGNQQQVPAHPRPNSTESFGFNGLNNGWTEQPVGV
jgi:hypothetical protein